MSGANLAAALKAFSEAETPATRRKVLEALTDAELLFPTDERKRLAFTQDTQGRPVLPAFTDETHLSLWLPQGGPYARAGAGGFLPSVLAGPFVGLVLNPGSEANALVDRRALEQLASGNLPPVMAGAFEALVRKWP